MPYLSVRPLFIPLGALSLCAALLPCAPATPAHAPDFSRRYTGTLNRYPIRMTLQRRGNRLTGSYTYLRNGVTLTLRGRITHTPLKESLAGAEFELDEYDRPGRRSGSFQGQFTSTETLRGSWWKTERPGNRLSFHAESAAATGDPFDGSWSYAKGGYTFSLDLAQRGDTLNGSYCAVTVNATRVDCISPVTGTVTGNRARVSWISAYGGGSGTALLTRQGNRLTWTAQKRPDSEHFAPPQATLNRSRR